MSELKNLYFFSPQTYHHHLVITFIFRKKTYHSYCEEKKVTGKTYWAKFHPYSLVSLYRSSAVRGGNFWCKQKVRWIFMKLCLLFPGQNLFHKGVQIFCLKKEFSPVVLILCHASFIYTQKKMLYLRHSYSKLQKLSGDFLDTPPDFKKCNTSENSGPIPSKSWTLSYRWFLQLSTWDTFSISKPKAP